MLPDLTLSIISANNLDFLLPCLHSAFDSTHRVTLEVFLVDNASKDDTMQAVQAEFPQVNVIHNDEMKGFASNNNIVLHRGRGRYLMLLNDDTLVLDGALDTLVEYADAHPQIGVIGSSLLNPDGTFQAACSRFPNPWIEGYWSTAAFFPRLRSGAKMPFETETVCGAALMVRREAMDQVGLLDAQFDPIYAEETDWCYRIKSAGWKVYSHPQVKIIHYGGQTMNRIPMRKLELLQSHKVQYFRKHHSGVAVWWFKTTLWATSLLKAAWYSMPWNKAQRAQDAEIHRHIARCVHRF